MCIHIDRCPSATGWCRGMDFGDDCINFILTSYDNLKKEKEQLELEINGIMHFVDKWLDEDEMKLDNVSRADRMREKTLKIIEDMQAHINSLLEDY